MSISSSDNDRASGDSQVEIVDPDDDASSGGTVADLLGLFTRRRLEAKRRARASEVLELCGLVEYGSVMAGGLTIAQARMLELARALADQPQVLLLDEPTSGLAEDGVEQATRILEFARQQGCAIGKASDCMTSRGEHRC